MIINSVSAKNYRSFSTLEEIKIGNFAAIIGSNDVGKSNILKALQTFIEDKPKLQKEDIHNGANDEDEVYIEVSFRKLPEEIEIEEGIPTTLEEENLLDTEGLLRLRKVYSADNPGKYEVLIAVDDFDEDDYSFLAPLNEKELNALGQKHGLDFSKSGRGVTNKGKREAIREKAISEGANKKLQYKPLSQKTGLWKMLCILFPRLFLFETDTSLSTGESSFQSQFRSVVATASQEAAVIASRDVFTENIKSALQQEVDKIFGKFQQHSKAFQKMTATPIFSWDKAVSVDIAGQDEFGVENSLEERGSGIRRLLMVGFFEYLAERDCEANKNMIFAIEEPENSLNPKLQRELVESFREIVSDGGQIIITTHSPVFAGSSPLEDITLVIRSDSYAKSHQVPSLNLDMIAEELGVEPADQVSGFHSCVFFEGAKDEFFWRHAAKVLKQAGHLEKDFDDVELGVIFTGGSNLKHWVSRRAMKRLNRRFAVVQDSDKEDEAFPISPQRLQWKADCEADGGLFFFVKKREVENYLHLDAIIRSGRTSQPFDDFTDMKKLFDRKVLEASALMTAEEILERDAYIEDGTEKHEILEIIRAVLNLN